jgi:protein TonB
MGPLQATLEPVQAQRASPVARKVAPQERSTPVALSETSPEGVPDAPHLPLAAVPGALAQAGIPILHDPVHYEARDLDTYPQLRDPLKPVYPAPARTSGIAGAVTLMVLVDETGRVTEASVVDARPEGYFDDSARNAIVQASFLPASKGGRAVRSRILVSISYDPAEPF